MDLANAIDEIWAAFGPGDLQPEEFTIKDMADEKGVDYDTAKNALLRALRNGKVIRRRVPGRRVWAYRLA